MDDDEIIEPWMDINIDDKARQESNVKIPIDNTNRMESANDINPLSEHLPCEEHSPLTGTAPIEKGAVPAEAAIGCSEDEPASEHFNDVPDEASVQAELPKSVPMVSKDEYDKLENRYSRLQADWDNYRRRIADERKTEKTQANASFAEKLLPIVDDFERSIIHLKSFASAEPEKTILDGNIAVYKKLLSVLAEENVVQIKARGEKFDAMKHQAIEKRECLQEVEPDIVIDVYQNGYMIGDRVLRPAIVSVSS